MPNRDSTTINKGQSSPTSTETPSHKPVEQDSTSFLKSEDIQSRIILINKAVMGYLQSVKGEPEILYEAAHHLILAGGKRLRSLVSLLCCEAVGGSIEKILPITVAAELLQTASLIHDDIIDKDDLRRGVPTVHVKYGHDIAILAGDFLIAQAFRIIGEHGTPELVVNISSGGVRMCEGEVVDLFITPEHEETFTTEEYMKMIERKTAVFLEEAARNGAIVGEASEEQHTALAHYGSMIGIAFQLKDDILDIQATQQNLKKTTMSDLRLKRGNYPLVYTMERCSKEQGESCLYALDNNQWSDVINLIKQYNALEHTMQLAQSYAEQAKEALRGHQFKNTELLEQLADFTVQRKF
ncbi:MAG: polyprenyl synthetase family protein [Promethearchaeota archaeon]